MSKVKNVADNLLARLGNAAAPIKFDDRSYHALECLFRLAKSSSLECVELEVTTGSCNLPMSDDVKRIAEDLSEQLDAQLKKLGVKQKPKSCHVTLFFDLKAEVPDWVNKPGSNCTAACTIRMD